MADGKDTKPVDESVHLTPKHVRMTFAAFLLYVVFAGGFLIYACITLVADKNAEDSYWNAAMAPSSKADALVDSLNENPTEVTVGTYVTDLKDMNLDDADFEVTGEVWFRWKGDEQLNMADNFSVYKGTMNKKEIIEESHDGTTNYQLIYIDVTISKAFWTVRFPLESHQLRMYIQSEYDVSRVRFKDDKENDIINPNLEIAGFSVVREGTNVITYVYPTTMGSPAAEKDSGHWMISEHMTQIEINRSGFSLYLMCFIALFGTITWAMITLFICTYHRVDPLGMIPGALFGTVANVMVGANKVPSMQMGLLLYMNFFGIVTILVTAITIIVINRIRSKYVDREFAKKFGRIMFVTELTFVIAGNILLPISAYMFT